MRQWARILGTDMDTITPPKEAVDNPSLFGVAPRIFPLAGILNPEAYSKLVESESDRSGLAEGIPEDEYERQVQKLAESGLLTEIDILSSEADKLVREKKEKTAGVIIDENDR